MSPFSALVPWRASNVVDRTALEIRELDGARHVSVPG